MIGGRIRVNIAFLLGNGIVGHYRKDRPADDGRALCRYQSPPSGNLARSPKVVSDWRRGRYGSACSGGPCSLEIATVVWAYALLQHSDTRAQSLYLLMFRRVIVASKTKVRSDDRARSKKTLKPRWEIAHVRGDPVLREGSS